jgi:hypothetical protein
MPSHHIDDIVYVPHTGQLARLQFSTPQPQDLDRESAPPPYNDYDGYYFPPKPHTAGLMTFDEEARCGFWDEGDALSNDRKPPRPRTSKRANHCLYTSFSFLIAVLYCFSVGTAAIFGFDLILTQLGLGFGLVQWLVLGQDTSCNVSTNLIVAKCPQIKRLTILSSQMHFCLATPNRQAPGPQTWRYITPDDIASCTTEVFTLSASATEQWKLRFSDALFLGEHIRPDIDARVDVDEMTRVESLGDDLAGEGTDRALDVYLGTYTTS